MAAYAETDFIVDTSPPLVLRVGQQDAAVAQWLAATGARGAAFVTAWNPFSRPMPMAWNVAAAERLEARVAGIGLRAITGRGVARRGDWPAEESLLIPGIDRAGAVRLGRDFGQNAILWLETGAAPVLVDCTDPDAG
jgi:hypothetical protein